MPGRDSWQHQLIVIALLDEGVAAGSIRCDRQRQCDLEAGDESEPYCL